MEGGGGGVISANYKFHLISVHDNLVQDPSNNKSLFIRVTDYKIINGKEPKVEGGILGS